MKRILKLSVVGLLMLSLTGCCFSIGKDCNKKTYCAAAPVVSSFDSEINSDYSAAYKTAVKSVVAIVASSTVGSTSASSTGSGIVFKEDTLNVYILTNKHVVTTSSSHYAAAHSKFEITFFDYTKKNAELVGFASSFDIAVLRVTKSGLTAGTNYVLPTVASAFTDVEIGNNVFAIGTPMSKSHAFSTSYGAVSNLFNISVSTDSALGSYYPIQMDAAVNPGNSGGGLFNLNAELIGVVQGGRTSSNGDTVVTSGINYAIPIDTALNVANQLIDGSSITFYTLNLPSSSLHPVKGIDNKPIYNLDVNAHEGIYVASNPAYSSQVYQQGMRAGFVILTLNGAKADNLGMLDMFEKSLKAGDTVVIKGYQNTAKDVEVTYTITIG